MVDIESLGPMPGGVILSIGWCLFDCNGADRYERGEVRLRIQPQLDAGLTVAEGELNFWLDQAARPWGPEVDALHPQTALEVFSSALGEADEVWAKPPQYDLVGIQRLMQEFKVPQSWDFRQERCFRTLINMAPPGLQNEPLEEGIKHGALVDAVHQAEEAAAMLAAIGQDEVAVATKAEWTGFPSFKDAKRQFERHYASDCLSHAQGNVSEAARIAGKDRCDFYHLLRRSGVDPRDFRK